jgi:hypothetical protein
MNKERLLALADVIQKGHHKFNGIDAAFLMSDWMAPAMTLAKKDANQKADDDFDYLEFVTIPDRSDLKDLAVENCNTAACMAGFACLIFDYQNSSKAMNDDNVYNVKNEARYILELDYDQANELFATNTARSITGPMAAKVIRYFVETGEVDWGIAYT